MTTLVQMNFLNFVWIWMHTLHLNVPKHHKAICQFLQRVFIPNKKALLMAFRGSGKSTLVGLFCAWLLCLKPDTRILILAADFALAKKMVQHIKRILEKHPVCYGLKPAHINEWAADRLTVNRRQNGRDPSVLAAGLASNITGSRADVIICDDVEVPKTSDTYPKRLTLKHKLDELNYVLTPNGMILYIGTPHSSDTIYNTDDFLKNWPILKIPLVNKQGQSNWPERFSLEKINELKATTAPSKFASQMMLQPFLPTQMRLDTARLNFYHDEITYHEANEAATLKIGDKQMSSVSCWWDPSFGSAKGDSSVIACVFSDDSGHYYLHRIQTLLVPPNAEAASYQCKQVVRFIRENYIPAIHLESNGIGKFLPALLRQELERAGIACAVLEEISREHKVKRILSAFEAPLMNGALFVHTSVKNTDLIGQMQDFNPQAPRGHDDVLDAVAGCLLCEPVRLKRNPFQNLTRLKWR